MRKILSAMLMFTLVLAITGCTVLKKDTDISTTKPTEVISVSNKSLSGEGELHSLPRSEAPTLEMADSAVAGGGFSLNAMNYAYQNESYLPINENQTEKSKTESMFTFSLKVDTAAYTNIMRYIENGTLPPGDAVRTEELLNYFNYDMPLPSGDDPFALYTEIGPSPFDDNKLLAFVRVKSKDIDKTDLPPSNLTFLIDTSGSMYSQDKLPLLKEAFALLVENLGEDDRVSIVTYAGSAAVILDSAKGSDKVAILNAISSLEASGSTAGAQGITTAYQLAQKNFMPQGNNRVLLATDGDFNVGLSSTDSLSTFIGEKRDNGIYLSILGFGMGNLRDDIMETLSTNGNGNYAYINNLQAAQKVLVEEMGSNLFTVADDVKAQIEVNPQNVKSYRLLGYENRMMDNEDFTNDAKDAGEIGAGTDVVVLFELELKNPASAPQYKYTQDVQTQAPADGFSTELFEVRIRYKDPGQSQGKQLNLVATFDNVLQNNTTDFMFAKSVAHFAHLLRNETTPDKETATAIYNTVKENLGLDNGGYRIDFLVMLKEYMKTNNYMILW